jgi:hypothetical protein
MGRKRKESTTYNAQAKDGTRVKSQSELKMTHRESTCLASCSNFPADN